MRASVYFTILDSRIDGAFFFSSMAVKRIAGQVELYRLYFEEALLAQARGFALAVA